jgi:hypothetical protein
VHTDLDMRDQKGTGGGSFGAFGSDVGGKS